MLDRKSYLSMVKEGGCSLSESTEKDLLSQLAGLSSDIPVFTFCLSYSLSPNVPFDLFAQLNNVPKYPQNFSKSSFSTFCWGTSTIEFYWVLTHLLSKPHLWFSRNILCMILTLWQFWKLNTSLHINR
jgi:hypothetical protein